MKNKIFIGIFSILILMANISFASYNTVTMSVVEEPICTINLGENSKFEKRLISKNLTNKEVTLQLQVTNQEKIEKPTGEIILVIDNSNSMEEEVSPNKTRADLVLESSKTFLSNLLEDNTKLKIGIVSFSSNTDILKEGSIEDATVVSKLSNDITELTNAISNIDANGPRTNLQAGLSLASEQFTKTSNNKYMIILTDGVPNVAIDYDEQYYSDDVITKTKQQLQSIDKQGIKIITMLTEVQEDYVPIDTTKSFGQIVTEIFGTMDKPNYRKFSLYTRR